MVTWVSCVAVGSKDILLNAQVCVEVLYDFVKSKVGWHLETPLNLLSGLLVGLSEGRHLIIIRDEDDTEAFALLRMLLFLREFSLERVWKHIK